MKPVIIFHQNGTVSARMRGSAAVIVGSWKKVGDYPCQFFLMDITGTVVAKTRYRYLLRHEVEDLYAKHNSASGSPSTAGE